MLSTNLKQVSFILLVYSWTCNRVAKTNPNTELFKQSLEKLKIKPFHPWTLLLLQTHFKLCGSKLKSDVTKHYLHSPLYVPTESNYICILELGGLWTMEWITSGVKFLGKLIFTWADLFPETGSKKINLNACSLFCPSIC